MIFNPGSAVLQQALEAFKEFAVQRSRYSSPEMTNSEQICRFLESLLLAGSLLFKGSNTREPMIRIMEIVGRATGASRSYWFENHRATDGRVFFELVAEWCAEGVEPQLKSQKFSKRDFSDVFSRWLEELSSGRSISGSISDFPYDERSFLVSLGVKSILAVPILAKGDLKGFLGLDNCVSEELWTEADTRLLLAAADFLTMSLENTSSLLELNEREKGLVKDVSDRIPSNAQQKHVQGMESMSAIARGISHNFRNILSGIMANSQLIQMKYPDDAQLQKHAAEITRLSRVGSELTGNLVQCSSEGVGDRKSGINLSETLSETFRSLKESLKRDKIKIHEAWESDLPVYGNRSALSQLFIHVCENARDAMPDGGTLRIAGKVQGKRVTVVFTDSGCGMEEGIAGKIFDPFFTTKPSAKHKGLGLSIGYGIVKDHEGQIKARSQKGKGASLEISFPLWTDRGLAKKAGKDIGRGRGERIMIVDDEEPLLETLEELLAGLGYKTISVESGSRAIDVYQKWQPKAVVLDRHMPGMDGLATSEALLALDPEAKIILASGYDEAGPNGIDDHIGKSIKGYLTKPFDIKQLSHLLAEVIER